MQLLVTGGAGFVGSNFIRHVLAARPDARVVNLDLLTYAGNLENLADVAGNPRYRFVRGDVSQPEHLRFCLDERLDAIVNFAAESHVDRAILNSTPFVTTNVLGTQTLLELARKLKTARFLQVSTDEVYGSIESGSFTEESPLEPNSPYAASKAAADLLVRAYHRTYGLDTVVTRCGNNYGPYQFPEKLVPLMICNALKEARLPVYGDGLQSRDWIHVEDHCRALLAVLLKGEAGSVYNIGAGGEHLNIDVIGRILRLLEKPDRLIQFVDDRPGHDRRYSIDASRIRSELGWSPQIPFPEGLRDTVQWYLANQEWVARVQSGAYLDYYRRMYEDRTQTLGGL